MLFAPKYRDDLVRYYRGTYVKLKEFQDELFFLEEISSTSVKGTHENGDRFIIYLNDETPYEVDYILPHKSFFQMGPNAVLLTRVPAKQYFRGLCEANTSLSYMEASTGRPVNMALDFTALKAFVNKPKFPSLTEAMSNELLSTVALSPRMMLRRTHRHIYIDFVPVAKVNPKTNTVQVTDAIFWDEVDQVLAARGDKPTWKLEMYMPQPKSKPDDLVAELKKTDQATLKATLAKKQNKYIIQPLDFAVDGWDEAAQ